jgi:pimeloyl-ACP methyl ester carboxylesterase
MSTATVVLVHGAWHDARCFERLVAALEARGVPAIAVDRPGHGASPEPLGDVESDAAAVRRALATIDGPVVLVGHSYGGAVITEAGDAPNVTHLVYLSAFVLDAGETVNHQEGVGEHEPSDLFTPGAIEFRDDGTTMIDLEIAPRAFYHDCDDATVREAVAQLQPQATATLTGKVTHAPWKTTPSTYIVCADDRAIVPSLQRWMAQRCRDVVELPASHSPFLSMPDRLADVLAGIARH